jgi:hypothetical protein
VFEAFYLLETAQVSGTIRDVPVKWAEVRRETKTLTEQGAESFKLPSVCATDGWILR